MIERSEIIDQALVMRGVGDHTMVMASPLELSEADIDLIDDHALGADMLRRAVAGMVHMMPDVMAVLAPNINSYRRFQPGAHVPMAAAWGYDNRTTALRIPSSAPHARRIEHRVAGADANPYLVLAAVLAGAHYGLVNELEIPAPVSGNAYDNEASLLPNSWMRAFDRFGSSDLVKTYFGEAFTSYYATSKEQELGRLGLDVTTLEYESYMAII